MRRVRNESAYHSQVKVNPFYGKGNYEGRRARPPALAKTVGVA